jgi:hypothetical protein
MRMDGSAIERAGASVGTQSSCAGKDSDGSHRYAASDGGLRVFSGQVIGVSTAKIALKK